MVPECIVFPDPICTALDFQSHFISLNEPIMSYGLDGQGSTTDGGRRFFSTSQR
jgi:hypothetical protein